MGEIFDTKLVLCPNCRTIQKAGSVCTNCKYPVPSGSNSKYPLPPEQFMAKRIFPLRDIAKEEPKVCDTAGVIKDLRDL